MPMFRSSRRRSRLHKRNAAPPRRAADVTFPRRYNRLIDVRDDDDDEARVGSLPEHTVLFLLERDRVPLVVVVVFFFFNWATIRERAVHRVILAGPRGAPVTPPSSILFDYSVMGEKKGERGRAEAKGE